ncbi:MBG domain-containing protein, partial [Acinetobacter baumannii]|uniref:MBG domain-containing protein n=1 Tax=Acinetobacter baumannii TaxID=470 RepID=UPI0013D08E10
YGVTTGFLVNGDTLAGALATTATATSDKGTYGIVQGTLVASANYAVTYVGANLTVNPRAVTVTANVASRIYGDANPALTWQLTGGSLVNGDSFTGSLATSATGTSNVGSYAVTQGTLATSSNYAVTYV